MTRLKTVLSKWNRVTNEYQDVVTNEQEPNKVLNQIAREAFWEGDFVKRSSKEWQVYEKNDRALEATKQLNKVAYEFYEAIREAQENDPEETLLFLEDNLGLK